MINYEEFMRRVKAFNEEICESCFSDDCECESCTKIKNAEDAWDSYCDECYHQERDYEMWREREGK